MPLLHDPRVQISVASGLDENNSHGSIWVRTVRGEKQRVDKLFFSLDKPHCVRDGLSYGVWSNLMRQLRKMGFDPTHMELEIQGRQFCYLADTYKEIYSGACGRNVKRIGLS